MFKNVLPSADERNVSMTMISWLSQFKEITAVCSGNRTKHMNALCGQYALTGCVEQLTLNRKR
jgi:hypothetical protein